MSESYDESIKRIWGSSWSKFIGEQTNEKFYRKSTGSYLEVPLGGPHPGGDFTNTQEYQP